MPPSSTPQRPSRRAGLARARVGVDGRCRRGPKLVSASAGRAVADQSRHGQQRDRAAAPAVGRAVDLRVRRFPPRRGRACGAAPSGRCFHGSRSTSASATRRSEEAEAAVARARAGEILTRLDVQQAVGTAFLAVVATGQAAAAAAADVNRRSVLATTARTLADNQLRPGAEASRADAELAGARTRAIQARQADSYRTVDADAGARRRRRGPGGGCGPAPRVGAGGARARRAGRAASVGGRASSRH